MEGASSALQTLQVLPGTLTGHALSSQLAEVQRAVKVTVRKVKVLARRCKAVEQEIGEPGERKGNGVTSSKIRRPQSRHRCSDGLGFEVGAQGVRRGLMQAKARPEV